jgi:Ca2+-binding RTX toxin-like protein
VPDSRADILLGEAGNDTIRGSLGNDTVNGGVGTDSANYSTSTTGMRASLVTNFATGQGSDVLLGIENLAGSPYGDLLIGSALANFLAGTGGADTVYGGSANDAVVGGGGPDKLFGQGGQRHCELPRRRQRQRLPGWRRRHGQLRQGRLGALGQELSLRRRRG